MAFAGFNSSKLVKGRLQAALYWNRKKNRERRIASETPAQDEPVDMLFDVAFQAMYNEPGGTGSVGIFMTNPEGPARGVLEQVVPATFFDDGVTVENYYNSVCVYTPETGDTYAYVTGITSQIEALGLDNASMHARIYQRDVLVDSVLNPVISSNSGVEDTTKALFDPLGITLDEYDHYRIRIFDQEPPADMQMLFGVEGVAGQSGATSAVAWNAEGNVVGSLSKLTPSYFTPPPESETSCSVESDNFDTSFYLLAAYSTDRRNVVSKGTGFDYAGQPVLIRVYGDGQLIGEQESTFYVAEESGYAISANFGSPSFSEGQTIAVRGWVPTASVQPNSPVALTPVVLSGTVQEGEEVNLEPMVWVNLFDGIESYEVGWSVITPENESVSYVALPFGTPYTLPAGSAGNFLSVSVQMTVNLPGETRGSGASLDPNVLIAAP